jgi:hypothetical protein
VHLLRRLCGGKAQGHLPQLRRQSGAAPDPASRQAQKRSGFDLPGVEAGGLCRLKAQAGQVVDKQYQQNQFMRLEKLIFVNILCREIEISLWQISRIGRN